MSGPGNVIYCLPVAANASNRCVLNTQVFASCCEASLNETIAIYCADSMDNWDDVTQQLYSRISNASLLPKIKIIYDKGIYVSEWCKDLLYLTENANKRVLECI